MNIFQKLFSKRETVSQTSPTPHHIKTGNWEGRISPVAGYRSLVVPAWYRGVTLLMQTMGQMKIQYQRFDSANGNFIEDTFGRGKDLNYILQVRPNPLMTASDMQEQIEFRKIYYGNAYVYIERNQYDDVEALWLCTGGGYNIINDTYELTYNAPGGPQILTEVPSKDVIHYRNVIRDFGFIHGIPVIDFAKKSLSIAATADDQTLQEMAKGGRHKLLVQENAPQSGQFGLLGGGRADKSELKKITAQLEEDWANQDAVFLNNIADVKIISQSAQELRLLEQRGFQVSDIARLLGIPRIMLMEDAGSSYRMPEHATQEFMLRTIQPRIQEEEDELNSKLLRKEDYKKRKIHICELALRRLDAKGQAEIDKLHMETGWSANEIRAQHDLPNIEGGDIHYISTNLAEIGSDKLRMGQSQTKPSENVKPNEEGGNE